MVSLNGDLFPRLMVSRLFHSRLKRELKFSCAPGGVRDIHYCIYDHHRFWRMSSLMTPCCDEVLLSCRPFITRTKCACDGGIWIQWWNVEFLLRPRGECVISNIVSMRIIDFDECHHWWRLVVIRCCCHADLSSCGLNVHVAGISGSSDEMLNFCCAPGGVRDISYR